MDDEILDNDPVDISVKRFLREGKISFYIISNLFLIIMILFYYTGSIRYIPDWLLIGTVILFILNNLLFYFYYRLWKDTVIYENSKKKDGK